MAKTPVSNGPSNVANMPSGGVAGTTRRPAARSVTKRLRVLPAA